MSRALSNSPARSAASTVKPSAHHSGFTVDGGTLICPSPSSRQRALLERLQRVDRSRREHVLDAVLLDARVGHEHALAVDRGEGEAAERPERLALVGAGRA